MKNIGGVILVLLLGNLVIPAPVQAAPVINGGVYIDAMDVSGLTRQQAKEMEKNYLENLLETKVTVVIDKHKAVTTLADLGYRYDQYYANKAANLGREGNLIERYKDVTDAREETLVYEHSFSLDYEAVENFVSEQCASYNVSAVNARIHQRQDGSIRIDPSQSGFRVVEDETAEKIQRTILEDWDKTGDIVIPAILVEDMPAFSSETAEECTDLLGSFTTEYHSSSESRCKNIANAAKLVNGTVLFPGEEFSMYKALYPISEKHGFEKAGSFSGGRVVQSVGGGICQATTTLYNALLYAELKITQRNPHSMAVKYVELGMDAAIAGTYKDLKFSNNLNAPVYVEAVTEGKTITFRIWGQESRPGNREIEYVTKILETIEPGKDVVTEDPNMLKGTGVVTQEAYTGYKVEVYKVVKMQGAKEQKEKVSSSEYAAAPRYITAGSADPGENPDLKGTVQDPDTSEDGENIDGLKDMVSAVEEE